MFLNEKELPTFSEIKKCEHMPFRSIDLSKISSTGLVEGHSSYKVTDSSSNERVELREILRVTVREKKIKKQINCRKSIKSEKDSSQHYTTQIQIYLLQI